MYLSLFFVRSPNFYLNIEEIAGIRDFPSRFRYILEGTLNSCRKPEKPIIDPFDKEDTGRTERFMAAFKMVCKDGVYARNSHDHFLPHSRDAYLTGHQLALEKAREASRANTADGKSNLLLDAYYIEAFACHFLIDCFCNGHIRYAKKSLNNS